MRVAVQTSLAVLAGLILAATIIAITETIGHRISHTAAMPFVFAVSGYGIGGFAGALLGLRLGSRRLIAAWAVVGMIAVLAMANTLSFPHPAWYIPAALLTLAAAGFLATRRWTH